MAHSDEISESSQESEPADNNDATMRFPAMIWRIIPSTANGTTKPRKRLSWQEPKSTKNMSMQEYLEPR